MIYPPAKTKQILRRLRYQVRRGSFLPWRESRLTKNRGLKWNRGAYELRGRTEFGRSAAAT